MIHTKVLFELWFSKQRHFGLHGSAIRLGVIVGCSGERSRRLSTSKCYPGSPTILTSLIDISENPDHSYLSVIEIQRFLSVFTLLNALKIHYVHTMGDHTHLSSSVEVRGKPWADSSFLVFLCILEIKQRHQACVHAPLLDELSFLPFWFIHLFILCLWVFCLLVCMCTTCMLLPKKVRKGCWIPWNWCYRLLQTIMWVLRIKPGPPQE